MLSPRGRYTACTNSAKWQRYFDGRYLWGKALPGDPWGVCEYTDEVLFWTSVHLQHVDCLGIQCRIQCPIPLATILTTASSHQVKHNACNLAQIHKPHEKMWQIDHRALGPFNIVLLMPLPCLGSFLMYFCQHATNRKHDCSTDILSWMITKPTAMISIKLGDVLHQGSSNSPHNNITLRVKFLSTNLWSCSTTSPNLLPFFSLALQIFKSQNKY